MGNVNLANPKATGEDAKTKMGKVHGVTTPKECESLVATAGEAPNVFNF